MVCDAEYRISLDVGRRGIEFGNSSVLSLLGWFLSFELEVLRVRCLPLGSMRYFQRGGRELYRLACPRRLPIHSHYTEDHGILTCWPVLGAFAFATLEKVERGKHRQASDGAVK